MANWGLGGGGRKDGLIYKGRNTFNLLIDFVIIIFSENLKHGIFIGLNIFFFL